MAYSLVNTEMTYTQALLNDFVLPQLHDVVEGALALLLVQNHARRSLILNPLLVLNELQVIVYKHGFVNGLVS